MGSASSVSAMPSTAAMEIGSGTESPKYRLFIIRSRELPLAPTTSGVPSARASSWRSLSSSSSSSASGSTAIRVTQMTRVRLRPQWYRR